MAKVFITFVVLALLLGGCAQKRFLVLDLNDSDVRDLKELPQDAAAYVSNLQENTALLPMQLEYTSKYYRIWNTPVDANLTEVMWPHRVFNASKNFYGINLKRLGSDFYERMLSRANFADFMHVNKRALTLHGTNIRAFPTSKVLLKNPNIPGEGFPFDYLQNSYIAANKPLLVSHFSSDKKWVFVFSGFTSGWVKSEDIVFLPQNDADVWMHARQVFVFQDKEPVVDADGYLFTLRIGMMLPLVQEDENYYTVLAAARKDLYTPIYKEIKIPKEYASLQPLAFTRGNVLKILSQLQESRYGWGGMFGERDCSATVRDYFAPFGIWLGRNSNVQAKAGRVISLEDMDEDKRRALIKQEGVPFETLLYRKGHILLYLGTYDDKIIVFQNVWGVKTKKGKKSGRVVIGRAVYSTLDLGESLPYYDGDVTLAKKLKSMNIVTETKEN